MWLRLIVLAALAAISLATGLESSEEETLEKARQSRQLSRDSGIVSSQMSGSPVFLLPGDSVTAGRTADVLPAQYLTWQLANDPQLMARTIGDQGNSAVSPAMNRPDLSSATNVRDYQVANPAPQSAVNVQTAGGAPVIDGSQRNFPSGLATDPLMIRDPNPNGLPVGSLAWRLANDPLVARVIARLEGRPEAANFRFTNEQAIARLLAILEGRQRSAVASSPRNNAFYLVGDPSGAFGAANPGGLVRNLSPALPNNRPVSGGPATTMAGVSAPFAWQQGPLAAGPLIQSNAVPTANSLQAGSSGFLADPALRNNNNQAAARPPQVSGIMPNGLYYVPSVTSMPVGSPVLQQNLTFPAERLNRPQFVASDPALTGSQPSQAPYIVNPSTAYVSYSSAPPVDFSNYYLRYDSPEFVPSPVSYAPGPPPIATEPYTAPVLFDPRSNTWNSNQAVNGAPENVPTRTLFDPSLISSGWPIARPSISPRFNYPLRQPNGGPDPWAVWGFRRPAQNGLFGNGPGLFGSRYTLADKIRILLRDWLRRITDGLAEANRRT